MTGKNGYCLDVITVKSTGTKVLVLVLAILCTSIVNNPKDTLCDCNFCWTESIIVFDQ